MRLKTVAQGFKQPTDLQFVPGLPGLGVLTEKSGAARWLSLNDGAQGLWFNVTVRTASEQGLLGLAFHPKFAENGRFFVHYVDRREGRDLSIVEGVARAGPRPRAGAPRPRGWCSP
ncbi:MAG: PQQ-dependent sugar dehydrogenase [Sandaracinaceae bacterium]|nr:PQQ-dependent sugar dehydrogenase [Sandaracinaceae bacterium]